MDTKRLGYLLTPSLLSGISTLLISVLALVFASWSYSVGSGAVYDFLFGPNSSGELIQTSRSTISAFGDTVFGNPTLNKILYLAFWMFVGLIVYLILFVIIKGTSSAAEEVQETGYANVNRTGQLKMFGVRAGIRLLVAVAWFVYSIFFIKILLPFSVLSARVGAGQLPQLSGWLYGIMGLLVLAVSLHIHVIFLRLVLLRVRVSGSVELR
jgi:hypothetical protein